VILGGGGGIFEGGKMRFMRREIRCVICEMCRPNR
jgi:hypothetical protein